MSGSRTVYCYGRPHNEHGKTEMRSVDAGTRFMCPSCKTKCSVDTGSDRS